MRLIYDTDHEAALGRYKDAIVEDGGNKKYYFYDSQGTWAVIMPNFLEFLESHLFDGGSA